MFTWHKGLAVAAVFAAIMPHARSAFAQFVETPEDAPKLAEKYGHTPAEAAKLEAQYINATFQHAVNPTLTFESATAHGSTVNLVYVQKDASKFASDKANNDKVRAFLMGNLCWDRYPSFLKRGAIIHAVYKSAASDERLEFGIGFDTCLSTPAVPAPFADFFAKAETIAELARFAADFENNEESRSQGGSPLPYRLERATAHGDIMEERYVLTGTEAAPPSLKKFAMTAGNYPCVWFAGFIQKGMSAHAVLLRRDGSTVHDITLDSRSCFWE